MFLNLGIKALIFIENAIIPDVQLGCLDVLCGLDIVDQPFPDLNKAASLLHKLDVSAIEITA